MTQLESRFKDFKSKGAQVLVIAAQQESSLIADVGKYVEKSRLSFPLLLDKNREVCKAYGVHHLVGIDALNIARPSAFIVGKNSRIKFIYVGASQTDRVNLDELIAALDAK